MVKVDIETENGKEMVKIKLKPAKAQELLQKMMSVEKSENLQEGLQEYLVYLDQVTSDACGKSIEWLNDLDVDQKNKLTGKIVELSKDSLGFSKLWSK